MAGYTYKRLCYRIPDNIETKFKDDFKREPDGDANYDGDYWTLADMYVDELIQHRDELLAALEQIKRLGVEADNNLVNVRAVLVEIADKAIDKAKGGAA